MKFRPLHDRVVLKRIEAEEKTSGGTLRRKSPRRARSLLSARAGATRPESSFPST